MARVGISALALAAVASVAYWAGRTVVNPPLAAVPVPQPALYEAQVGTIGDTQPLTVEARWPAVGAITVVRAGTVTSAPKAGSFDAGDVAALVDERPIVVVESDVPFFRDMREGASGRDVLALQRHLAGEGFYEGEADGLFGSGTASAVRAWQVARGFEADGVVGLGDVTAISGDRAKIRPSIRVGDIVSPGDVLAEVLARRPAFSINVEADAGVDLASGTDIEIRASGRVWGGVIGAVSPGENDSTRIEVIGRAGRSPCGARCSDVPLDGITRYPASAVVVPEVSGVVVPTSAIVSLPDGSAVVSDAGGRERPVEIVASIDGLAVVEGIDAGTEVRLPDENNASSTTSATAGAGG